MHPLAYERGAASKSHSHTHTLSHGQRGKCSTMRQEGRTKKRVLIIKSQTGERADDDASESEILVVSASTRRVVLSWYPAMGASR